MAEVQVFRYVALIWNTTNQQQAEAVELFSRKLKVLSSQWREVHHHDGLRVFCVDSRPGSLQATTLTSNSGVVLGTLFERNHDPEDSSRPREAVLDCNRTNSLLESCGRALITDFWGNYVAFICHSQMRRKWVVKDPTGNLPCYFTQYRGAQIFFSCIEDCIDLHLMPFTINRSYLHSRLLDGGTGYRHNPIEEIALVFCGECIEIDTTGESASISRRFHWAPLDFSQSNNLIEDPDYAARAMRATVRAVTHSLAACHSNILLRLSGGLDSSIISGCLRDAPTSPQVTCYTHFNPRGRSDERPWAAMAASFARFEHVTCPVVPEDLPLENALQMPTSVTPTSILEFLQRATMERTLTAGWKSTAVFTGDGGDSGFCSDSIGYALSEYFRLHGLITPHAVRLASQIALLVELSTWKVFARSLRRWRAGSNTAIPRDVLLKSCRLVNPALIKDFAHVESASHPWFRGVRRVPGGILNRLGMLLAPPDFYNASPKASDFAPEIVSPLYSQPVLELLLRIPIHVHFENGQDRGLARRAFAPDVPQSILQRRWKDRAPGFHDELIYRNLNFLQELFLDGVLVKEGLLDRAAVEQALSAAPGRSEVSAGEILNHMGIEIWARRWLSSTRQRAAA